MITVCLIVCMAAGLHVGYWWRGIVDAKRVRKYIDVRTYELQRDEQGRFADAHLKTMFNKLFAGSGSFPLSRVNEPDDAGLEYLPPVTNESELPLPRPGAMAVHDVDDPNGGMWAFYSSNGERWERIQIGQLKI